MELPSKVRYPDIPSSLEEMDSGQKAIYFGTEILHIFKSSGKIDFLRFSLFLLFCGMIGNAILVLLVLVNRTLHKTAYICEMMRSLSDMSLMVTIAVLLNSDMYSVDAKFSSPIGLLICIFIAALYSSFEGLYKSVYMCLFLSQFSKVKLSTSCSAIMSVVVVSVVSLFAVLFLAIMYCVNILAFVVFASLFYFSPFILSWILEVVKFKLFKRTPEGYELGPSPSLMAEYHESNADPHIVDVGKEVVVHPPSARSPGMSTAGKFVALLAGVVRSISFSIMTMVIVRITWVFFRNVTPVPVLESLPSIMEQIDLQNK